MIRRSTVTFYSGSSRTRGQLGNTSNALTYRSIAKNRVEHNMFVYGGGHVDDIVGSNTGQGQAAAMAANSLLNRYKGVNFEALSSRTTNLTSLAHNVRLLERTLIYTQANTNYEKTKVTCNPFFDEFTKSAKEKKDAHFHHKNPFLTTILDKRLPNTDLSEEEVSTLRRQQRLIRSEFHSRMSLLLENAFLYGIPQYLLDGEREYPKNNNGKDKNGVDGNRKKTKGLSTYTAGGNLTTLAAFFNLFRLSRLSFTLEGEIILLPNGSMEWHSIRETDALMKAYDSKNLFSNPIFRRHVGHGASAGNILYGKLIPNAESIKKDLLLLISSTESSTSKPLLGESVQNTANDEISTREEPSSASETDAIDIQKVVDQAVALVSPAAGNDHHKLPHHNSRPQKNPASVNTSLMTHVPSLQRSNETLHEDMQNLLDIALNAVEVELRGIAYEIEDLMLSDENQDSSVAAAAGRRVRRLFETVDTCMFVISDAIFMCGRGTHSVENLLDAVENISSHHLSSERNNEDESITQILSAIPSEVEAYVASGSTNISQKRLLGHLLRIRRRFYAPSEELNEEIDRSNNDTPNDPTSNEASASA